MLLVPERCLGWLRRVGLMTRLSAGHQQALCLSLSLSAPARGPTSHLLRMKRAKICTPAPPKQLFFPFFPAGELMNPLTCITWCKCVYASTLQDAPFSAASLLHDGRNGFLFHEEISITSTCMENYFCEGCVTCIRAQIRR